LLSLAQQAAMKDQNDVQKIIDGAITRGPSAQRTTWKVARAFLSTGQPGVWRTSNGGLFIVDKVVGKHEYITIAIGINANGTVKQIEVMEYKESYGYEVRNAAWRAQFVGKNASSPLQLNVDIKNISGATLSSKHISDGVKRILQKYASSLRDQ